MTERISHEEARRALHVPWDITRLRNYINQQAALEADTVSRAEPGSMQQRLATMTQNNAALSGQLTALQAEHEAEVERLEKVVGAREAYHEAQLTALQAELATERARAEEAERLLGNLLARIHRDGGHHQADCGTVQACEDADTVLSVLLDMPGELAAVDARVARLEEQLAALQQETGA